MLELDKSRNSHWIKSDFVPITQNHDFELVLDGINLHKDYRLNWQFCVDEWDLNKNTKNRWFISQPGYFLQVFVKLPGCGHRSHRKTNVLSVVRIKNSFQDYIKNINATGSQCNETTGQSFLCFNFSAFDPPVHRKDKFYVLLVRNSPLFFSKTAVRSYQSPQVFDFTQLDKAVQFINDMGTQPQYFYRKDTHKAPPRYLLSSWNKASRLCRSARALLPVFSSSAQTDYFIALAKLVDVPHIEAIFIGLTFFTVKKVICDEVFK